MPDWEKTIIPLEEAHEVLSVFGIGPSSRRYQRWRRDDGFRHVDFEGVLGESRSVLTVDWRESLQDAVDTMIDQLEELGIKASADVEEEDNEGLFHIEGQSVQIQYLPEDNDNFDRVIEVINRLITKTLRYRKFRSSEGNDSWSYAVLKNEDWDELESVAKSTIGLLFV